MSTYLDLPKIEPGESDAERLEKLILWGHSLDGYLYSIGAALTELRKEIGDLKEKLRDAQITREFIAHVESIAPSRVEK